MIKTNHLNRLWLSLLLLCFNLHLGAANISITGYSPKGEYNGEPLFELGENLIQVKLSDYTYLTTIKVDGNTILYGNGYAYYRYVVDVSEYNDGNIHQLEIAYGDDVHNGICYFKFEDEVFTPNPDDFNAIRYEVNGDVAEVVGVDQSIKVAVISSEYADGYKTYPVTSINSSAFSNCEDLVSIRIPESITTISADVFGYSDNLKCVHFDAIDCSIVSGEENDTYIWQVFPSSVERVVFGDKVTIIPDYLFKGCSSLKSLDFGKSIITIGKEAFEYCTGLTNVVLPNTLTTISDAAFAGCTGLTSINIPQSVTSIGWSAFSDCNFSLVYIPASVSNIGHCPFYGCENLTAIIVDSRNEYYSAPGGILLSKDETEMIQWPGGKRPFYVPSSVHKIGWAAFADIKDLTTIEIPTSVTEIGIGAFGYSGIKSIKIPNSITKIEKWAFMNCHLNYISIPNSVEEIGESAFSGCGVDTVNFESIEVLTSIRFEAELSNPLYQAKHLFINGKEVTDLVIPNTITEIGNYAFVSSKSVISSSVTCLSEVTPTLGTRVFSKNVSTLYVPKGSVEAYRNSDWAQYFSDIREIENSLTVEIDGGGKVYASVFDEVMSGQKVSGSDFTFFILPDKDNQVASIMLDDEDITDKLIGHHLTIADYNGNGTLKITFEPEQEATLTVRGADNHSVTHTYKEGSSAVIRLQPEEGWELHSVTYNGEDITDRLNDNMFVSEPLHGSNNLNMVLINTTTDLDEVSSTGSGVRISVSLNKVTIHGLAEEETVSVYDMSGSVVYSGFDRTLTLNSGNVYILTTPSKTFKIAI